MEQRIQLPRLTDHGFPLETACVLKGGRKVWPLAKTNMTANIKGNDTMNGHLLLSTGGDGALGNNRSIRQHQSGLQQYFVAVAFGHGVSAVKVPHSSTFDTNAVKIQLGLSSTWENFIDQMKALSECKLKSQESEAFLTALFTDPAAKFTNELAIKKVLDLYSGHGRGAELSSAKNTAFGLLNAVTEFFDHERQARNTDYRLDSSWLGELSDKRSSPIT